MTSPEHSKSPSEGWPKIGDAHPVVLVISGYAPWKQISNLLTLASTQHGNTLRIDNTGSTSWKPLRSSSRLARDDDDDLFILPMLLCVCDRLSSLQSSENQWQSRVPLRETNTPRSTSRPTSIAQRLSLLSEAQKTWTSKVQDKDTKKFTVDNNSVHLTSKPTFYFLFI